MIQQRAFGKIPAGERIDEYTLTNTNGLVLKVITYGGIVTQLHIPDKNGRMDDVVLGFDNLEQYLAGHPYFGCITGRVAGRLTHGNFSLDGKSYSLAVNNPPNHLHGGSVGFDKRVWRAEIISDGKERLRLSYLSPADEEGYPGNVQASVTYSLTDANEFVTEYEAIADQATPLNLTNHSYFNLAGEGSGRIDDHILQIFADDFVPADETMTLLDRRESVAGHANDFTRAKSIGEALPGLWKNHGDVYFIRRENSELARVAKLFDPHSGRVMEISSTEPCLQLYTGVSLDGTLTGKSGRSYGQHTALCLECENYPNGVNAPQLGNIVLRPGVTYRQTTVHKFSTAKPKNFHHIDLNIHPSLPSKKDFRIGILGSGFIVSDCHLVSYRKAGFNPVAIASRSRENAAKVAARHAIPKVYDSYEQLLDDKSIEVLDIAVPPNAQLALIKAACERKTVKGILAQKPLGMNYTEALEAVQLCERAGIVLAVNQNMRYDQSVRAGQTLLTNGTIGEPVFATIDMRGIPHWMPWQAELGWVTLRVMSIHHIDCFRYWFGDPENIFCSTRPDPRTKFPHTDGICTYILEYTNGLRCVAIDDTWTGPAKENCPGDIGIKWRIEGLNGLAIGDLGWCKDPYTSASTIRYASKGDKAFHEPKWSGSWFPDAFAGTMGQLLVALETGKEPAISGRDNLKTMALVDAAYLSAEQKRAVKISEIIS